MQKDKIKRLFDLRESAFNAASGQIVTEGLKLYPVGTVLRYSRKYDEGKLQSFGKVKSIHAGDSGLVIYLISNDGCQTWIIRPSEIHPEDRRHGEEYYKTDQEYFKELIEECNIEKEK